MIVLFTDFGLRGPYVGQVEGVLEREAPGIRVVNLTADAPVHDPKAAAYLLAAYAPDFPAGSVFLAVVDPGVGGERLSGVLEADGRWYVGPGSDGLFELVARRAREARWHDIRWRSESLSRTFHGRDLFAPVAARIATALAAHRAPGDDDGLSPSDIAAIRHAEWPDDLTEIIFVDDFGNAMTGLRAETLPQGAEISVSGRTLARADTFADVAEGTPFWYENANGLVEISVNRGRADRLLDLLPGSQVAVS